MSKFSQLMAKSTFYQIKRIFANIMAKSKRLILLHPISRTKMAADTRCGGSSPRWWIQG
jgi:hypothetical protein